jgi:hypothetical protein
MRREPKSFVFVTGPYSAGTEAEQKANIQRTINIGRTVFEKGYYPIVPHLLVREYYVPGDPGLFGYEPLMRFTLSLVAKCDILLLYEHSPGADRERKLAEQLGKPIYFSVDDLPDLTKDERNLGNKFAEQTI